MHLDQLLSRKAIEGAQAHGMMLPISAARQPLKLVSTRAHRWSSPALLFEREITMDRRSIGEHSSAEWNSSSVDDDPLLLDRTDHDLATRNKSDPLSISTHSGGYLLPPLQAPSGKANPLTVASWSSLLSRPQERRTTGGKQPYEHNDNVEDHCLEKKTSSPFVNVFDDVTWFGDSPRAFSLDTTTTLPPPPSRPSSSFLTSGQVENPLTRHALGNYHPQFSDVAHPSFNIFPRFHPDTDTNNPSAVPADLAPTMDREDLFLIPHHSYHQDFPPPSRTMRNSIGRGDTHDHHERSRRMPKDSASNSPGNEDEEGEKMMTLGEALPILEPRTIEEMLENKTSYQQK